MKSTDETCLPFEALFVRTTVQFVPAPGVMSLLAQQHQAALLS